MPEYKNDSGFQEGPTLAHIRKDYKVRYWTEKLEGPSQRWRDVVKARGPRTAAMESTPKSSD